MSTLADAVTLAGIGAALAVSWRGLTVFRRESTLGTTGLSVFLWVIGLGAALIGGVHLTVGLPVPAEADTSGLLVPLYAVVTLSAVPWLLFCLRYTGRYTEISRRLAVTLAVPVVLLAVQLPLAWVSLETPLATGLRLSAGILNNLLTLGYTAIGVFFLLRATGGTRQLRLRTVAGLAVAPVAANVCWRFIGFFGRFGGELAEAGLFAAVPLATSIGVSAAVDRYGAFRSIPAVRRIGRQDALQETDDLVFILDDRGRVTELNDAARQVVEPDGLQPDGGRPDQLPRVESMLGHDVATLRSAESVTLETEEGPRRYDPQLSSVTDHRGRELGLVCSLRDVTARELREQRLAVLNRVLRHNLRNRIDVIRAHAETLDAPPESERAVESERATSASEASDVSGAGSSGRAGSGEAGNASGATASGAGDATGGHVAAILDAADEIAELGETARLIDRFVSASDGTSEVAVEAVIACALDRTDTSGVSLTRQVSPVTLHTNRAALEAALDSVIDNAVSYADSTVSVTVERTADGCLLRVTDDGPGIPDGELASLDDGTETPLKHGTGLGLWQLKWAVTAINGELSFDTTDGTTVEIRIPDQSAE